MRAAPVVPFESRSAGRSLRSFVEWPFRGRSAAAIRGLTVLVALIFVGTGTFTARPALAASTLRSRHVIVRTMAGHEHEVERKIASRGGKIGAELPIIHGFSATIPAAAWNAVIGDSAVRGVTENGPVTLSSTYDPSGDPYSLRNVEQAIRATDMWAAGYTGAGVDVALIDSGVVPVQGLSAPGKVINGPDLSFESQSAHLRYLDTFGHGTHMAGIIAGRDDAAVPGNYQNDTTNFLGIAPDARIVSVKVADSHGNADVSQIIAAIDWVVQHAHDQGLNVRILNLSFGTASMQNYLLDPLAFAAEVAWHRGIAVVAAVGNTGGTASRLADPAMDPWLIAVGAADHHGSNDYSHWEVAPFSQAGDGRRNPDILAPGAHIQSLRDPGSFLDQTHPGGVIGDRFFRGSGSSQSVAIVSGALALLFQEHPSMTPDQAKALLTGSASSLADLLGIGPRQGRLALRLDTALVAQLPYARQRFPWSFGFGSLERSRGGAHLVSHGVPLQGEIDIFGKTFNAGAMAWLEAFARSWSGGVWNGNTWAGSSWSGNSWDVATWSGNSWDGNTWAANTWDGNTWDGNTWDGTTWAGNTWDGNTWDSDAWSSASWS